MVEHFAGQGKREDVDLNHLLSVLKRIQQEQIDLFYSFISHGKATGGRTATMDHYSTAAALSESIV